MLAARRVETRGRMPCPVMQRAGLKTARVRHRVANRKRTRGEPAVNRNGSATDPIENATRWQGNATRTHPECGGERATMRKGRNVPDFHSMSSVATAGAFSARSRKTLYPCPLAKRLL